MGRSCPHITGKRERKREGDKDDKESLETLKQSVFFTQNTYNRAIYMYIKVRKENRSELVENILQYINTFLLLCFTVEERG